MKMLLPIYSAWIRWVLLTFACLVFSSYIFAGIHESDSPDTVLDTYPKLVANAQELEDSTRIGDRAVLQLVSRFNNGQIFYTLDGSQPNLKSLRYVQPFTVTSSVVVRQIGLSEDFTETANIDPISIQIVPTFVLTTSVMGQGTIQKTPALDRYLQDDVVGVKAVPNPGWRFIRWEGELSGAFADRNVAMGRDKSVRAVFEPIPRYTLSSVALGGTVSGAGTFQEGTSVSPVASPSSGWTFLGWSGDYVGSDLSFPWIVDGPARFVASFGTTISNVATGSGKIVFEPDLPIYPYGTQVKVIPLPNPGYVLALWGGVGAGQPEMDWILTVTNAQPKVTALFQALASDKVAVSVQSTLGGTVTQPSLDGVYTKGSTADLTAVPAVGYEFAGWTGDASGTVPTLRLNLDSSKSVRAEFRRIGLQSIPLTVVIQGPGGVRRIPDLGAYETGSEVELVADVPEGSVFQGWTGGITSSQKRVRLTMGQETTVKATFLSLHPVATEVRGEGQVLLSPPEGIYAEGTSVALTAKPAEGWGFVQWLGDLATTSQEAGLTVDAPQRVIAEFARLGTLTTRTNGGGSISRTPDAASYLPGTQVTLKATPTPGWKFLRWTGGASGTNAELSVVVGRTEAIVAEFGDGEAPVLILSEPQVGTVTDERFRLRGSATDNVQLASVTWSWNGVTQGALKLSGSDFAAEGLVLRPGKNEFVVMASDLAGNQQQVSRTVAWTPLRTLAVQAAAEVQEGQVLRFPLTLSSSGEVGGMTFWLQYDPVYLSEPQLEWGASSGQSINTLNTATNGQIWATFSLAGTAIPSGTNTIANVSFRARSVPKPTVVSLTPTWVSVGKTTGEALPIGNAAIAAEGRIQPRKIIADNNANQRLDIGDGVLLSRLQVGLDEVRPWDVTLNDLNTSGTLDNGDVIKVLRVVVGQDPQPQPARSIRLQSSIPVPTNTNDVIAFHLPDGLRFSIGQPYRVQVRLEKARDKISGIKFRMMYSAGMNLVEKSVGSLVPSDALVAWNPQGNQIEFAAIRPTPWPSTQGLVAEFTFQPTSEAGRLPNVFLSIDPVEVTGSGFDTRSLDGTLTMVVPQVLPQTPPTVVVNPVQSDGTLGLEMAAPVGTTLILETTTDLNTWSESDRFTAQGEGNPVQVKVRPETQVQARFWRVRIP